MSVVGGAAGGEGEGAAGCNDKNKNPTIECGEKRFQYDSSGLQMIRSFCSGLRPIIG